MTTDKTLADVQPGGRVRLGDAPERCAECRHTTFEVHPEGHICVHCKLIVAAQPSPGGQGALVTDAMVYAAEAAYANSKPDNIHESFRVAIAAALAARQPVGESVAHEYTYAGLGKRDSVAFIGPEYRPAAPKGMQLVEVRPLYYQPAHAVDLDKLRALADRWATDRSYSGSPADDLRAWIDSQA